MSQSTQDRRWEIVLEADEFGNADHRGFEADVQQAMAESAAILLRLGGAIQSYVIRQQDPASEMWFPIRAVFKWQSFVPGIRAQRAAVAQPPAPEPEIDLEPEDDEPESWTPFDGTPEPEPDEDGQVYEKGGEQRVASSAAEQQELLRDGWKPVARV